MSGKFVIVSDYQSPKNNAIMNHEIDKRNLRFAIK